MQTSKTLFRIVSLALAATFIIACSKEAKKTRFLAEADSYFKASNYDKAKVSYLNVVRLDPQNALAFERIGTMWHAAVIPPAATKFQFFRRRARFAGLDAPRLGSLPLPCRNCLL